MSNLVEDTDELSDLLDELDEWSFQRSERLDVKKPGPQFSTNNYAFQVFYFGHVRRIVDTSSCFH